MGMTVEQIIALIKCEMKRAKARSEKKEGKEEVHHLKLQYEHSYMTLKHLLWLIEKRMAESEEQKGARELIAKQYKDMKWYVYHCSISRTTIKTYNIFEHSKFYESVVNALKECETKEEFAEKLRRELFYYYCSKQEWETEISPLSHRDEEKAVKIDVYSQVYNN